MRVNNKADNAEKTEQKGLNLRQSDKILLVVAAVLLVVIILLHVLNAFGLALINGALSLYLPMLLLFVLLGWGVYALIRRARRKVVKTVLTSVSIRVSSSSAVISSSSRETAKGLRKFTPLGSLFTILVSFMIRLEWLLLMAYRMSDNP